MVQRLLERYETERWRNLRDVTLPVDVIVLWLLCHPPFARKC